jgi:hypothetical protein
MTDDSPQAEHTIINAETSEMRWEATTQPTHRAPKGDVDAIHAGLEWMLMTLMPYVLPVELIYRELARPKPEETKPANIPEVKTVNRDDVTAIIARKRIATADELQDIISHAKELYLTTGEREQLALDLSIFSAQRASG